MLCNASKATCQGQGVMCRSGLSPEFLKLAKAGHIEAWNLPLGMSKLLAIPCTPAIIPATPCHKTVLSASNMIVVA